MAPRKIPCDCTNGYSLVTEYSEENLGNAFRDDHGYWWNKCDDCDGTGEQDDSDSTLTLIAL
jgi:hypothetical protein